MTQSTSSADFSFALPEQPTGSNIAPSNAMPSACAREHGDYSDGDYSVAVLTASAPSVEESNFSETLRARCGG